MDFYINSEHFIFKSVFVVIMDTSRKTLKRSGFE